MLFFLCCLKNCKNYMKYSVAIYISALILIISCSHNSSDKLPEQYDDYLTLPSHFPEAQFPKDNPYSKEKAELGRYLFYEPLLVNDTSFPACSHCMKQEYAFSNNKMFSRGSNGLSENRNNMTLINAIYRDKLFWDGRAKRIEGPAYRSLWLPGIFNSDTNEIVRRLEQTKLYPNLFKRAFGENTKISAYLVSRAIATFVRTLVSGNSKYDKYLNGDKTALNNEELQGMKLFFSEQTRCSVCHSGIFFTDLLPHNTGVTTHYFDKGHYDVTGKREHRGTFITPTLRNVEKTAPYMHDGALATLEDVMDHYNRGGKYFSLKDTLMRPLNLNSQELNSIISFIKTLTDTEFLSNPKYSNPHIAIKKK